MRLVELFNINRVLCLLCDDESHSSSKNFANRLKHFGAKRLPLNSLYALESPRAYGVPAPGRGDHLRLKLRAVNQLSWLAKMIQPRRAMVRRLQPQEYLSERRARD